MTFDSEPLLERTRRAGFSTCREFGCDELWRRYLPGEPNEHAWASKLGLAVV